MACEGGGGAAAAADTYRITFCASSSSLLLLCNEFAKPDRIRPVQSGQDQTCSVFPKFVTENGQLSVGGFSVTNLGNLDRIRHDQGFPNS